MSPFLMPLVIALVGVGSVDLNAGVSLAARVEVDAPVVAGAKVASAGVVPRVAVPSSAHFVVGEVVV